MLELKEEELKLEKRNMLELRKTLEVREGCIWNAVQPHKVETREWLCQGQAGYRVGR